MSAPTTTLDMNNLPWKNLVSLFEAANTDDSIEIVCVSSSSSSSADFQCVLQKQNKLQLLLPPPSHDIDVLCSQGEQNEIRKTLLRTDEVVFPTSSSWAVLLQVISPFHRQISALINDSYVGYGSETGLQLKGHQLIRMEDKVQAASARSSLLYGEILPSGVSKMLSNEYMCADDATVLYDLGCGLGKVCMQAFLEYPNLKKVVGVELSTNRSQCAISALDSLLSILHVSHTHTANNSCCTKHTLKLSTSTSTSTTKPLSRTLTVTNKASDNNNKNQHDVRNDHDKTSTRQLTFKEQDLFNVTGIEQSDIVILQTQIPQESHGRLCAFLVDRIKIGARILTYENLEQIFADNNVKFPFQQLNTNKSDADKFYTSWAFRYGHHFYIWEKTSSGLPSASKEVVEEMKEDVAMNNLNTNTINEGRKPTTTTQTTNNANNFKQQHPHTPKKHHSTYTHTTINTNIKHNRSNELSPVNKQKSSFFYRMRKKR